MKPALLILLLVLFLDPQANASGPPVVRMKTGEQGISYHLKNLNARTEKDANTLAEVEAWLREAVSGPEELVVIYPGEGTSFRAVADVLRLVKAAGAKYYSVTTIDGSGVQTGLSITGETKRITTP